MQRSTWSYRENSTWIFSDKSLEVCCQIINQWFSEDEIIACSASALRAVTWDGGFLCRSVSRHIRRNTSFIQRVLGDCSSTVAHLPWHEFNKPLVEESLCEAKKKKYLNVCYCNVPLILFLSCIFILNIVNCCFAATGWRRATKRNNKTPVTFKQYWMNPLFNLKSICTFHVFVGSNHQSSTLF